MTNLVIGPGVVKWVAQRMGEHANLGDATGIGLQRDGEICAGVAFSDWNGVNVNMHVAAVPGKRWLNRDYLWACFDYAFVQLGCDRITGLVGQNNLQARTFDQHLGFCLEATLRGAHPSGDLLVYVMWREECKWIKAEFSKRCALARATLSLRPATTAKVRHLPRQLLTM